MATASEQRRQAIEDIMDKEEGEGHPEPTPQETDNETDWEEEAQQQAAEQPEGEQPAEEPAPAEAEEQPQQPDRGDKGVALREARQEAREQRDERARLEREVAELRGQMQAFMQQQQKPPEQPAEPEDPEPEVPKIEAVRAGDVSLEDYLAAQQQRQAWADRQRDRHEKRVQEFIEKENQRQQQNQEQSQLAQSIQGYETRFRQQTPDYDDALQHLVREEVEDLTTEQFLPPERAQQITIQKMLTLAQHAMAQNRDPAALLYALSKRRGFGAEQPKPNGGLGAMATQSAPQQQPAAPQQQQSQLQRASPEAQAEAALSGASSTPTGGNTLQALLDTPEEDLFSGKVDGRRLLRGG